LLFLDVGGALLPFAGTARQMDDEANPLLARLDPEHGRVVEDERQVHLPTSG
jgi:hypothetical protein